MNASGRAARRRGAGSALSPLMRCPLLAASEYAALAGVTERRARAILTALTAAGLVGQVRVARPAPGHPLHLSFLTAAGVAALADRMGATPEVLAKRYGLGERALVARLGILERLLPARAVLIALGQALPERGGMLVDWRSGPVHWPRPDGGGPLLILDGEGTVRLVAGVWRVALLWDGDPSVPAAVLAARLARLDYLATLYRGAHPVRVPPVLVVTAAAARIPPGYHPGGLWTTTAELAAQGPLAAWHGGRGPGGPRPLAAALGALATTRAYATPGAVRRSTGAGAPPANGDGLAARLEQLQAAPDPAAPLGLVAPAVPTGARPLLDLVSRHPLLAAGELAQACGRPAGYVRAVLATLGHHGLVAAERLGGRRARVYVATMRGLRLLALGAGLDPATYAHVAGALVAGPRCGRQDRRGLRFLRSTPAHTRSVHAAYLAFAQAARATGGTLEWRGEWACPVTFADAGRLVTLRPDGAGVLATPAGRLAFYLEVDRGTTQAWRLGRKLAAYERYRLVTDAPPFTVLLILPSEDRAAGVLAAYDACRERGWGPGRLALRRTTAAALAAHGPLAPIWRGPSGYDGLFAGEG